MKSNIEKDSCEDKMASCEAENGNNVDDKAIINRIEKVH